MTFYILDLSKIEEMLIKDIAATWSSKSTACRRAISQI
jgi:hypothetical protein